jgi:hypothetical protein
MKMKVHIIPKIERRVLVVLGLIVPFITVSSILTARADSINPGLYSVDSKPYGLTFTQWSEKWWQWFISIPQFENPLNDDNGKYCAVAQNDPNVWFITGAGSGTVVRSCNIPSGKAILFHPAGNGCPYAENPSLKTESELRSCAIAGDQVSSIHVSIDGRNLQNYVAHTPLFDLTLGAQSEFLTYDNSTYGIRMLYPSNWLKLADVNNTGEANFPARINFPATFFANDKNSSIGEDEFPANVLIAIEKLPSFNVLLDDYTATQTNTLKNDEKNFVLLKSNATTLSNNTAHEIIWTTSKVKDGVIKGELKRMQVFTIIGDKAYVVRYTSELTKYPKYLPTVQKMIDSFQVIR